MNIGAVAGAAVGGPLADRLGRKLSMVASTVPLLVGWMMQGMASSMTELLVGRIAVGVGIGVVSCVVPVYLAEIAPTSIRGALASLHEMGIMMGVLAVYAMGTNAVGIGWRGLSFAGMIPAGFLLAGMLAVPETPRWLVSEGRKSTAKKALRRLRRTEEVDAELWEIERTYLAVAEEPQARLNDLIDKEHRGALIVAVGLMLAQQLSGVNAIIGYSDQILLEAGMKDADVAAVLVAGLQAVATFFAVMFMDSGGRRLLLFISSGGMSASAFVLGMAFLLENHLGAAKGYLATGGCMVFVISYALGLGAIPWIIMGEIFTSRAKGMGSAVAVIVNWGMAAIIMATYEVGANMIHDYGMFFLYSGFLVLGIIFTAIFVPETKNRRASSSPSPTRASFSARYAESPHAVLFFRPQKP